MRAPDENKAVPQEIVARAPERTAKPISPALSPSRELSDEALDQVTGGISQINYYHQTQGFVSGGKK